MEAEEDYQVFWLVGEREAREAGCFKSKYRELRSATQRDVVSNEHSNLMDKRTSGYQSRELEARFGSLGEEGGGLRRIK